MNSSHATPGRSAGPDSDATPGAGLRQRLTVSASEPVPEAPQPDRVPKIRLEATTQRAWGRMLGAFFLGMGTAALLFGAYFSAWHADGSPNVDFDYIDDETFPFQSIHKWFNEKSDPLDIPHAVEAQGVQSLPPPTDVPRNEAYEVSGKNGVVAADEGTCSNMGVDVLRQGGNSVDAAITSTLCLGLLNSFSSGLGGGGFMLVRVPPRPRSLGWSDRLSLPDASRSHVAALDFRETSPGSASADMYAGRFLSAFHGGLAIAVPGELKGLWEAYEQFGSGRLEWAELVRPVARMAMGGWRVSRELARRLRTMGGFMADDPAWHESFMRRGRVLVEGDWMKREAYGRTLQAIAKSGVGGFYGQAASCEDSGGCWIAESMTARVREAGGVMTRNDLSEYRLRSYNAIHTTYHGLRIYTTDAPSAAPALLGLLKTIEPFNITLASAADNHRLLEAIKFAFAARVHIADPACLSADQLRTIENMRSEEAACLIRMLIDEKSTHTYEYYNLTHSITNDSGTTHTSIVDRWGGAVSITSTLNLNFGSRVLDPHTGIIFNSQQADFSRPLSPGDRPHNMLPPAPHNLPGPGKRSLSSATPVIIEHIDTGQLFGVLGGAGGVRIFPAVAQVLLGLLDGKTVSDAVEDPRFHDQLVPSIVTVETGYNESHLDYLRDRGHNITLFDINLGVAEVQAIRVGSDGMISGASDSRKHGRAAGF